ncbi:hypothetical protein SFRURICE_010319 [Spodoptera frugiperda]|nr:hypothetical protein SFRURICE_010319 [Spodoptera frugiperda]
MGKMDDEFYSGVDDVKSSKEPAERNGRIIVRNISFKATKEALKEHFSKYGTVQEVNLLKKPDGKLVGCGFVHFADVTQAEKAIAATNKKPFLDRPIHVAFAVSKKAYVQNMENNPKQRFNGTSEDDDNLFSKDKEETDKFTEEKQKKERINRNARLVVRNVSFKATEETLKEHFAPYGDILEVKLLKKPDGKLVGCAFVHFKNVPMAKKALLNTNMKPFLGRPISVDWAVAKNKYMQHVVSQQLEMEEKVKKEESDSDDDDNKPPLNVSADDIKDEIKSESKCHFFEWGKSSNDFYRLGRGEREIKLNDAEDGCTVFITNIPFSVDNEQLRQFAENVGPVKYALICVDRTPNRREGGMSSLSTSKGNWIRQRICCKLFNLLGNTCTNDCPRLGVGLAEANWRLIKRVTVARIRIPARNNSLCDPQIDKEHADAFLSLPADQLRLEVVVAGTKAAVGVSASDMAKRLALERSKTQMLKNLNRFVSRYRLVVSNLPAHYDDAKLRRLCAGAGDRRAVVTECRVMRDLRTPPGPDGKNPSKGYGFVMFTRHEDALACLRKLNNNPDVFDKNNRPIVSFSIEDRTALNARKKRLEKSIANNPLANKDGGQTTDKRNRKRKPETSPDESYAKRRKFGKLNNKFNKNNNQADDNRQQNTQNQGPANFNRNNKNGRQNRFNKGPRQNDGAGQFVKKPRNNDYGEYTGLTAKEGSQHKMRSNHKLKAQAELHRQTVKTEKKMSKRAQRLKMAAKERIKSWRFAPLEALV